MVEQLTKADMKWEELGKIVRSALNMFEQVVDLKSNENHHHSFFSCSNEVIPLLLLVASKVTPLRLHLVSATNKQASHGHFPRSLPSNWYDRSARNHGVPMDGFICSTPSWR